MSNLIPRNTNTLATTTVPDGFNRHESKELARQQNAEVARGLVVGTRLQAAGFVANLAMQTTASLSREARFLADSDERTAERLDFIVDGYAALAVGELNRFRF